MASMRRMYAVVLGTAAFLLLLPTRNVSAQVKPPASTSDQWRDTWPDAPDWKTQLDSARQRKSYKRMEWFLGQRGLLNIDEKTNQQYHDILTSELAKEQAAAGRAQKKNRLMTAPGSLSWSALGPAGIDGRPGLTGSWWGTSSGRVRALAIHPTNENIAYIGAAAGGLWKTTDGGSSWSDIGASLASLTYGAIAIDPNNPNTVYAGGGEVLYSTNPWLYDGRGMFKSTDAGATWTNITNGFGSQTQFGAIAVSRHNSNVVFAALGSGYWHLGNLTNEGVWRSTDAGTTWTRVLNQSDAHDVWVHPDSAGYIYAAIGGAHAGSGVYRSTDNGATWSLSSAGLPVGTSIGRIQVSQSPARPATMYSIIYNGTTRLYKTTDGGAGWFQVSVGTQLGGNYGGGWSDQGWYDLCVAAHPTDTNIVMTGNMELFRATNGASMNVLRTNPSGAWYSPCHVDYHIIRFSPSNPNVAYIGSDGGVYKSTDAGATWFDVNNGINTIQFYRFASHPTDPNFIIGGAQDNGNYRTTNGGSGPWEGVTTGDGMYCAIDPGNTNIVYMSTQTGNHMKSTNGGATFGGMVYTGGGWLSPLVLHPKNSQTLFVANTSVRKSTNSGASFTTIASSVASDYIVSLDLSPSNPAQMVFAANDAFSNLGLVRVSQDSGATWTTVSGNIPGTTRYVPRVYFHPTQAGTFFVVRSGFIAGQKLFRTTDMGATFTNVSGNLPNVPHNDVVVDPSYPNEYYIANDFGVYHSTDYGATWTREGTGMPFVPAMDIDIAAYGSTRYLRAATHGRGLYQSLIDPPCTVVSVSVDPADAPVCVGTQASFTSGAAGSPSPSVVWEYRTSSSGIWSAWPGGITPTLSFTATSGQNGYQFRAIWTNTCSSDTSAAATLTTTAAPQFTGNPVGTGVCAGQPAGFAAIATGATVGLQWQVDQGSGFTNLSNTPPYSGVTTPALGISAVTTSMNGYVFRCVATGACSPPAISTHAPLTVYTLPSIGNHPATVNVCAGGDASFSTTASGTSIGYQWEVNTGSGFTPLSNTTPYSNVTTPTMSITGVASGMAGYQYRCVVTGMCSPPAVTNPAVLNMSVAPTITQNPTSQSDLCPGSTVTLTAAALGSPPVQWEVSTNGGANWTNVSGATNPTYSFTFSTADHLKQFQARFTSSCGTGTTTPATVSKDLVLPSLTAPTALTLPTDTRQCGRDGGTVVLGTPVASDNCTGLTMTHNAPSFFPKGTTSVLWTATDASGNVRTATQLVTINDVEPARLLPPANIQAAADPNACTRAASSLTLGTPVVTDNCPGPYTVTHNAPASFPVGTTLVTWTVRDASNNVTNKTQKVIIFDAQPPTITAPVALSAPTSAGLCSRPAHTLSLGTPTVSDNCAGVTFFNNAPVSFPKGVTTVTWTARDAAGNTATATQTVTINDTERPSITAPVPVTVQNDPWSCARSSSSVSLGMPRATDNCGAVTLVHNAPAQFPVGNTLITWTATDGSGNTATATQQVTVVDTTRPEIVVLLANPSVLTPPDHSMRSVQAIISVTDNCGSSSYALASITSNEPDAGTGPGDLPNDIQNASGTSFQLRAERADYGAGRMYTVTYRASDAASNTSMRSVPVFVPFYKQGTVRENDAVPAALSLEQNFPNPFNPSTVIRYRIPEDGHVTLRVYDMYGREVATLVNEVQSAGVYSAGFLASSLPSGIYMYRLEHLGRTLQREMALVK
ncbi:MAG: HYR domain-containing protein [Ignavibacteriae bacterium]|nr:HYR domain-containing protein [Ignavibacteriota bacterium]